MTGNSGVEPTRNRLLRPGGLMRKTEESVLWVVYRMAIYGKPTEMNAICEQGEWDAMELAQPGVHTLIRAGIPNEGEAERLARGGSGDRITSRSYKPKGQRR